MTGPNRKLIAAAETYFAQLHRVLASGGGTDERSHYPALANLLNAVGQGLKPKVFCVPEGKDQGAGHPDFALYTANQVQKGRPRAGQLPERGAVEVKGMEDDAWLTAQSHQVSRYLGRYRLLLVTNLQDFMLVGEDGTGGPAKLETFRLAENADDFRSRLAKPRAFAREVGAGLGEYLARALSHRITLTEPKDLAWLLASYARDGLARIEAARNATSLVNVRSTLEEALGIRFEGERGEHFFHSTLIQTLFYGVFSAWVLWSHSDKDDNGPLFEADYSPRQFRWREAVWHLRAPVLRALFAQLSDPGRLQPLDLVEVMNWTAAALDRVDRSAFFARFDEGEAVPYFYEPFLEAFDPALRKQLGVWYTPTDVVRYMVARVDKALKNDLGIADGIAAENVYVLDPCCGTGAFLAEVLRRIGLNLGERGLGALTGAAVRKAATKRVFGFEIMPAPFVVAHLQVGLTLQSLDAPLAADGSERAGVFLTNALTGWEPRTHKPLLFPELEEERDRAERVKQDTPILVILGNPPYNGFAGMAVDEERGLSNAYRTTRRVRRPEGQGLNDLYVRFFRMAERRIAEQTGRGVVCFISNYSWLDGLSFTGMREHYLEAFDAIRIDCLNGDKYKTGKVAPDGSPDPSIFSTEGDPVGIQVGTAIATLVRQADHKPTETVEFRNLWGRNKPKELIATAEAEPDALYSNIEPVLPLGLPFAETAVSTDWFNWPALPDLFPVSFPGVKTSRDGFLVDTDLDRLRKRVGDYFDPTLSHEEIARKYPSVMKSTARFDARAVRDALLCRGGPDESGFVKTAYRPFDNRWLYWEADDGLLDRPRADYRPHVFAGNLWMGSSKREIQADFSHGTWMRDLANWKYGFWGGTVAIGVGCGAERAQWGPGDRICVVSPTHSPPDPRMATIIQLRDQPFTDACPAPDRCGGCGAAAWHGHGRVPRTVTDLHGDRVVSVRRYRCQACGHTVTVAPAGVDAKGRTRRLRAHLVLLYCLGLSHRGVEAALAPLGVHVDHVTVWRDLQELAARMQARGPVGKVRVAMLDETWIPIGGGKRPVAVVTDAADGTILQLEVSDGDFDWQAWLAPLAGWGVEVVVTDDDSAYGAPLEAHGLDRQQCMVHMRRTFTRRLRKLPEEVRERYAPRLKRLRALLRALPAEGAAILMGWLEEAVDPAAPAPKAWRSLVQHFLERWNQMRIHCRAPDVPATTNRLEGRFGRLKPRVRRARGFPTLAGARNFLHAVTQVCA